MLLGKTTTPEFGCKGETNSPLTGISRNPWNLDKTPGGSSGGTAAAVAAGMGPVSIGTDGAGSIRIPGAFCGNVAFKPSFGRVPAYPLSFFGTVVALGSAHHERARCRVDDERAHGARRPRLDTPAAGGARLHRRGSRAGSAALRVAWSPKLGYAKHVDLEVAAACEQAVHRLADLGAHVEAVDPGIEDPLEVTCGLWFVGAWTIWNTLSAAQQTLTDPDFAAEARLGASFSALEVQQLNLRRGALGSHLRQFMQRYDLLVTPTVAIPAFDARPPGQGAMSPEALLGWTPFSYPFNLTQQPACTVPCGLTATGLPIGLQFVGPMFGDALVLRAARAYETASRPLGRPPLASNPAIS